MKRSKKVSGLVGVEYMNAICSTNLKTKINVLKQRGIGTTIELIVLKFFKKLIFVVGQ